MQNERVELKEAKFEQRQEENLDKLLKTLSSEEYFGAEVKCQYDIKRTNIQTKKDYYGNAFEVCDREYILSFKVGLNFDPVSVEKLETRYLLDDPINVSLFMGKPFRQMPCVDKALDLIRDNLKYLFYIQCHSGD